MFDDDDDDAPLSAWGLRFRLLGGGDVEQTRASAAAPSTSETATFLNKGSSSDLTFLQRITRKKHLSQLGAKKNKPTLKKVLSSFELMLVGVGMIIGAGIFTIVGKAAREAGPSLILSFVTVAMDSCLIALCYSELASCLPVAGSAYSYAYIIFGELVAWFIGWNLALEYSISAAVIARSWSGYVATFLGNIGLELPHTLVEYRVLEETNALSEYLVIDVLASCILVILTGVVCLQVKKSVQFNAVVVVIKVSIIIFFFVAGLTNVDTNLYTPFFPNQLHGMFKGAALVFFAFLGFDSVSSMAEEAATPHRDLPFAIIGSLLLCTVLYLMVACVLVGMQPYNEVALDDPLASAFETSLPWAGSVISFAAAAGLLTGMLTSILGQSRIFMSMGRNGLIPMWFAHVDPTRHTPIRATLLSGLPSAVLALFFQIDVLGSLTSLGACCAFVLVCSIVLLCRYDAEAEAEGLSSMGSCSVMLYRTINPSLLLCWFIVVCVAASTSAYSSANVLAIVLAAVACLSAVPFYLFPSLSAQQIRSRYVYGAMGTPESAVESVQLEGFLCPWVPTIPLLGIMSTIHIMIGQGLPAFLIYGGWVALGMGIYFSYGFWKEHDEFLHDEYSTSDEDDDATPAKA